MRKREFLPPRVFDRINRVVYESGLTQAEFARRMGVSRSWLLDVINYNYAFSTGFLIRFCAFTGVSADYILFGRER